ncbi:hypothetical protein LTR49_007042 [Elasticomyces elasticus]|nr:hypothetical protein LTR49_007042 [Elasticomyces elasticus]
MATTSLIMDWQSLILPFSFVKPGCIALAAFWLIFRAYSVLKINLDDLAGLLGFDIPIQPIIDLAAVKSDGCIVHWSLPEKVKGKSKLKWEIHLNGVVIDSVGIAETAVTITGLLPGSFYVVRVALVNEQEFGSRSEPIRFRTRAATSGDSFTILPDGHEDDGEPPVETLPRVRVYRGLKDVAPVAVESTPMGREHSNSGLGHKRSITGRRPSPAALGLEPEESEPPEGQETIQQLTERLDSLRYDTEETDRLGKEEEEEETRLKEELTVERDGLRAEAAEKERATRNIKREMGQLERQNTAAQNERSKHERLLQQKKSEREKVKQDILRWGKEATELLEEADKIRAGKATHLQQIEKQKEKVRVKLADEAGKLKGLEDEVKETNAGIKRLERAVKNASPEGFNHAGDEPSLVQQMQQDAEEERQWAVHKAGLSQQYTAVFQRLEAAKRFHGEHLRYLESVRAQRRQSEEVAQLSQAFNSASPVATVDRTMRRGDSQRSRRAPSGQSQNVGESPRMMQQAFPPALPATAASTAFPFAPFFNVHNGMTLRTNVPPPVDRDGAPMSASFEDERERLTGGAPMSPGAGAELLPADLFSGEGESGMMRNGDGRGVGVLPGLGTVPGLPPGLPAPSHVAGGSTANDNRGYFGSFGNNNHTGPASPGAVSAGGGGGGAGSRSPSLLASPQASQQNLHGFGSSPIHDNTNLAHMDVDGRSIRSTRSSRAATGTGVAGGAGSRFSSMFGIKARTKTVGEGSSGEDGLALGKAQSHSMPRQDGQGLPGLNYEVLKLGQRKRNSSISGGVFGGEIAGNGGGGEGDVQAGGTGSTAAGQVSRRKGFGGMGSIFSRDKDGFGGGWPSTFTGFGRRPGSPRPGSTHSNELPRPSMDSSRWGVDGWPSNDTTAGARSSPLSFTAGWPVPTSRDTPGSRLYGSRHPSRRPSVQYGTASGPPEDIMEDSDSDEDALSAIEGGPEAKPQLAPIGTRPNGKKVVTESEELPETTPPASSSGGRLNPAAKDFKSFFGIKSKEKGRTGSPSTASTPREVDGHHDESPPDSRKSRSDARSLTTTESSLADSGDVNDLARTPSYANSDATSNTTPLVGSTGKESFMQKITRKSSSSKFSLPTFKREKSRLDPSTSSTSYGTQETTEEDGDMLAASVGSLKEGRESKEANRGSVGKNWSSKIMNLGGSKNKRNGGETPSLSGLSMASGTEDGGSGEED